jgi:hypothetical protein
MMPRRTEAERKLAEADQAVQNAVERRDQAQAELYAARQEAADLEQTIEQRLYAAAEEGTYDPAEDRATLADLNRKARDLEIRLRALDDRVTQAEQARDRLIAEEFISLSGMLAARADEYRRERAAFEEKWAAEAEKYQERELALRSDWRRLIDTLPAPIRVQARVAPEPPSRAAHRRVARRRPRPLRGRPELASLGSRHHREEPETPRGGNETPKCRHDRRLGGSYERRDNADRSATRVLSSGSPPSGTSSATSSADTEQPPKRPRSSAATDGAANSSRR